jgi:NADH dehydrogenase
MARLFVTGAAGFLGRSACRRLREHGHSVAGLVRRPSDAAADDVVGDLDDVSTYAAALPGVDTVVHLAAITGRAPAAAFEVTNVGGTRALVDAASRAGVARFLFCSSIAVTFADTRHYPYAGSKIAGERIVRESGLRFTIIRPTIIAGPGAPVMSRLAGLARLPLVPAFGGARVRVQPILVDDLADFIVDLVEAGRFLGETLELGGPEVVSLRQLLSRLRGQARGEAARFLPVPLAPVLAALRVLEPLAGPALPLTIGQLATFRFDGIARPNSLWEARRDRLASIDRMLDPATAV